MTQWVTQLPRWVCSLSLFVRFLCLVLTFLLNLVFFFGGNCKVREKSKGTGREVVLECLMRIHQESINVKKIKNIFLLFYCLVEQIFSDLLKIHSCLSFQKDKSVSILFSFKYLVMLLMHFVEWDLNAFSSRLLYQVLPSYLKLL